MGVIAGQVKDNKQIPIPDVKIGVTKGTASYPDIIALTDDNGEYDLEYISTGTFEVTASKDNYITQTKVAKVKGNEETKLDFVLELKD
ncbi:MAG: carboxypeptidase regulatory-like domain-containing protein [Thermoplasmatales archaeon]|nr:MAG: carboxypeptidase regulatory-like domain-containing protein [Thermoplasmatales archaeon]